MAFGQIPVGGQYTRPFRTGGTDARSSSSAAYSPSQQAITNRMVPQMESRFQNTAVGTPQSYTDALQGLFDPITSAQIPQSVIDEQAMARRAFGEQQAGGFAQQLRQGIGGRGFTSGSAGLGELYTQAQMGARQRATTAEREGREFYSQFNANQDMLGQQLNLGRSQQILGGGEQFRQQDIQNQLGLLNQIALYRGQPLPFAESESVTRTARPGGPVVSYPGRRM